MTSGQETRHTGLQGLRALLRRRLESSARSHAASASCRPPVPRDREEDPFVGPMMGDGGSSGSSESTSPPPLETADAPLLATPPTALPRLDTAPPPAERRWLAG